MNDKSPNDRPSMFNVTNLLVVIALTINGIIFSKLESIDEKIFCHLTNASIHIPRETVVSKDEFMIYQVMRDKQNADMKIALEEIKSILREPTVKKQ